MVAIGHGCNRMECLQALAQVTHSVVLGPRAQSFIIIKLPDQAIASTPSAPRPPAQSLTGLLQWMGHRDFCACMCSCSVAKAPAPRYTATHPTVHES
jgi:hypothetical protein